MTHVAIITIGTAFMPGVEASYSTACQRFMREHPGDKADVSAQKSMCLIPYFGLNAMKNFHACKAKLSGYTHALFVDNDIQFIEEDIIARLLSHGKQYIVPFISSEWTDGPNTFANPNHPPNTGLNVCNWAALACVMVDLSLVDKAGTQIFTESFIQQEDEYTCLSLRAKGIGIYQDSNTPVKALRPSGIMPLIERYAKL